MLLQRYNLEGLLRAEAEGRLPRFALLDVQSIDMTEKDLARIFHAGDTLGEAGGELLVISTGRFRPAFEAMMPEAPYQLFSSEAEAAHYAESRSDLPRVLRPRSKHEFEFVPARYPEPVHTPMRPFTKFLLSLLLILSVVSGVALLKYALDRRDAPKQTAERQNVPPPAAPAQNSAPEPEPALSNEEDIFLRKRIRQCTVRVSAKVNGVEVSFGTGVAVGWMPNYNAPLTGGCLLVVTNSHVVFERDEATGARTLKEIEVFARESTVPMKAHLVGAGDSDYMDLAYLLVESTEDLLASAVVAGTRDLRVGTDVYACGHPRGENFEVTKGKLTTYPLEDAQPGQVMAHTAVIERGSSGGGLFNSRGELIGINTWLLPRSDNPELKQDIGLAQDARWFMDRIRFGRTEVSAQVDWTKARNSYGGVDPIPERLEAGQSIVVMAMGTWTTGPGSDPVTAAGTSLEPGGRLLADYNVGTLLLRVGGTTVPVNHWHNSVAPPGSQRCSPLFAGEGEIELRINDTEIADNSGNMDIAYLIIGRPLWDIGVETEEPTAEEREQWDLWRPVESNFEAYGAKVTSVKPLSPAANAGVREGDFLVEARALLAVPIPITHENLKATLRKVRSGGASVSLTVRRNGQDTNYQLE